MQARIRPRRRSTGGPGFQVPFGAKSGCEETAILQDATTLQQRKQGMRFWTALNVPRQYGAVFALGAILVAAAAVRLHHLAYRTLNHPEVYTPGIDLPWNLSNPNPRFSLWQMLAGTIAGEPHPPGYYIVMLGWTEWFGSSILALRLPSVLFGVASVALIYVLARYTNDTLAALLAAAMLALNGLHVYVSQTARMYSMACFLGLLSTVLLVVVARQRQPQLTYRVLYVLVTLAGLATHVYVWPLFATQALWVIATHMRGGYSLAGLLRLQLFTTILATPLLAIAAFQAGAASRPPTLTPFQGVLRFLQAGALFEVDPLAVSAPSFHNVAAIVALLATALLLASAMLRKPVGEATQDESAGGVQGYVAPLRVTAVVGVLMASSILMFAYVAKSLLPARSNRLIIAMSLLPLALLLIDVVFCRRGEWIELRARGGRRGPWSGSPPSLSVMLAVLPVSIVAAISVLNPVFIQRGTVVFAPYLIIVLAGGLASIIRRDRRYIGVALILAVVHGMSVLYFNSKSPGPDYKGLAARWVSHIESSDVIFVYGRGHPYDWRVAPIFYYLNARRYHFVGRDFLKALENHPRSRVWVLSFPPIATEQEALDALQGYEVQQRVAAQEIFVQLYVDTAPGRRTSGCE
jgi:4-amino-4-deoxy-L-arabinose transferase-like glycosyltransferase